VIYDRSTSPSHPQREDRFTPYKDMADAQRKEHNLAQCLKETVPTPDNKKQRSTWDWDLFKPYNEPRNRTTQVTKERRPADSKGAKWHYFGAWDVSKQRPDAHLDPGPACLHCEFLAVF
ncbi:MAG: hypothetical protein NXY57DRAFT_1068517, partial [Lentinula lateritia]